MNKIYSLFLLILITSCLNISTFERGYLQDRVEQEVEIPFEFYRGLILITASFNGAEGKFLYDNGASYSCINADFARKAKIDFKSASNISDGNNRKTSIKESTANDISIQNIHFKKTGVYLIDTKQFFPCNDNIDGIIGASIINKVNWLIDFKEKKMKISSKPFSNKGVALDIDISSNNSSFLAFDINGFPVKAKVDFGYSGQLKLRAKEYKEKFPGLMAEQNIGISSLSISGLGKNDTTYDIHTGINMNYEGSRLQFPPEINLTQNLKYKARIGTEFFRNYEVAVNSSEQQYLLRPYAEKIHTSTYKSYGINIYQVDDTYRVIQVNPAQIPNIPIEVMDAVVEINGESVSQFADHCELRAYMSKQIKNQETLYLRLKGNDTIWELPYTDSQLIKLP